jgi:hypothetical protein
MGLILGAMSSFFKPIAYEKRRWLLGRNTQSWSFLMERSVLVSVVADALSKELD